MQWVVVTQWGRTICASPPGPKPSQQVWRAVHVHTQQWAYEAGRNKDAGRVIEPRKGYSRGQQDIAQRHIEGKADGCHAPEGRAFLTQYEAFWAQVETLVRQAFVVCFPPQRSCLCCY
jgi:hypothetical protein